MKIYGNTTSPYVRRLRVLLAEYKHEFEFINIFGEDRARIKEINPTLKIPMFEDLDAPELPILLDSQVAFQYLEKKLNLKPLTIEQQNELALINSCNEAFVNQLILKRSGADINENKLYFNIQKERINSSFEYFEKRCKEGAYNSWNYVSMSLLILIEWVEFRSLFSIEDYPRLKTFVVDNQLKPGVKDTKPSE